MNNEQFVSELKRVVRDETTEDTVNLLRSPPGRGPSRELVEMSNWFNSLNLRDQSMLRRVLQFHAHDVLFGVLAIIDGSSQIEDAEDNEEPGRFEIRYITGSKSELVNDPQGEFLHDILNRVPDDTDAPWLS